MNHNAGLNGDAVAQASSQQPVGRRVGALIGGGLLLTFVLLVAGWVIVHVATPSAATVWEDQVNQWFVAHRTPQLNAVSHLATTVGNTRTCTALLVVMVIVLRLWLHRWRESLALTVAIAGEVLIFLAVSAVVGRQRPDVAQLDVAPPTSSFPSGHTGAAFAFYGCVAVILWRQLRPRWFAVTTSMLVCVVPVVVGVSRLYRGMHHPLDVLFGAVCGGVWLILVLATLLPRRPQLAAPNSPPPTRRPQLAAPNPASPQPGGRSR